MFLYRGCIPSKALLHVAKVMDEPRHAGNWGITFAEPKVDVNTLRSYKQGVVDKLTAGVGSVAKMRKVRFLQGRATLTGPRSLSVAGPGGGIDLQFEHLILATGSHPTKIPTSRSPSAHHGLDFGVGSPDVPILCSSSAAVYRSRLGSVYATLAARCPWSR